MIHRFSISALCAVFGSVDRFELAKRLQYLQNCGIMNGISADKGLTGKGFYARIGPSLKEIRRQGSCRSFSHSFWRCTLCRFGFTRTQKDLSFTPSIRPMRLRSYWIAICIIFTMASAQRYCPRPRSHIIPSPPILPRQTPTARPIFFRWNAPFSAVEIFAPPRFA